jgi:uncharacterized repeat protein (TIGR03803 family)
LCFNIAYLEHSILVTRRFVAGFIRGKKMSAVRFAPRKTLLACGVVLTLSSAMGGAPAAAAEKTIYKFRNGSDGATPLSELIADGAGNLYGTTNIGGRGSCEFGGCGTVFKVTPKGAETILYAFTGGSDGEEPVGGLVVDESGNLYGTAAVGGSSFGGTVFKLAPDGTETTLYTFQDRSDGMYPQSTLLRDGAGDLFGTTLEGGSFNGADCQDQGCGTVFELKPDGTKLTLYTFQGGSDGWSPTGALIADQSGNLYGTTEAGGDTTCDGGTLGCGTVFKLAPDGTETQLHAFHGGSGDGSGPEGGVIADAAGNLYGTTGGSGSCPFLQTGCGTVFRLAPDGTETVLYDFQGGSDGVSPRAGLIMDKNGDLYGTTEYGGGAGCKKFLDGCGTVFKLTPDGKETVLARFEGKNGNEPTASLLLLNNTLYGTTSTGGHQKNGVVFELKK